MKLDLVNKVLSENLLQYEMALMSIKQCLSYYENVCEEIISKISRSQSVSEADKYFQKFSDLQIILSNLLFKHEINRGKNLKI